MYGDKRIKMKNNAVLSGKKTRKEGLEKSKPLNNYKINSNQDLMKIIKIFIK